MDAIGGKIADAYLDNGLLGASVLVLLIVCVFLWRAREADRKGFDDVRGQAEEKIAELQEKRITEQARVIEAMNKSASITELMGSRIDSLADALRHRERH